MLKKLLRKLMARPVIFILKNKVGVDPEKVVWTSDMNWKYGIMYPDDVYSGGAYIEADGGKSRFSIEICALIVPV